MQSRSSLWSLRLSVRSDNKPVCGTDPSGGVDSRGRCVGGFGVVGVGGRRVMRRRIGCGVAVAGGGGGGAVAGADGNGGGARCWSSRYTHRSRINFWVMIVALIVILLTELN